MVAEAGAAAVVGAVAVDGVAAAVGAAGPVVGAVVAGPAGPDADGAGPLLLTGPELDGAGDAVVPPGDDAGTDDDGSPVTDGVVGDSPLHADVNATAASATDMAMTFPTGTRRPPLPQFSISTRTPRFPLSLTTAFPTFRHSRRVGR